MLISLILLIFGAALIVLSVRQFLFKRKLLRAGVNGLFGSIFLGSAALLLLILSNLQTYFQLTKEIDLVDIEVTEVLDHGATVNLTIDGKQTDYLISTDEWRLDARFIKWKPWFTVLGKEPIVRLEALSGKKYRNREKPVQIYHLSSTITQVDQLTLFLIEHLGILDVVYGSSVYMPIETGARFRVSATHAGLIARPINEQGRKAVHDWN